MIVSSCKNINISFTSWWTNKLQSPHQQLMSWYLAWLPPVQSLIFVTYLRTGCTYNACHIFPRIKSTSGNCVSWEGCPTEYTVSCLHLRMLRVARSYPYANHHMTRRPHRKGGGGDNGSGRAGPTLSPSHSPWSCGPVQWWTSPPCTSGSIQMHVPETEIQCYQNILSDYNKKDRL
jgi:hypothetical protein